MSDPGDVPPVPHDLRPRRRTDLDWVVLEGETVVWDPVGHHVHRFDRVGSALWEIIDGTATITELAQDLVAVSGLDEHEATATLINFTQRLADHGLLADGPATETTC